MAGLQVTLHKFLSSVIIAGIMPLFMVKKEVFEWIRSGQKNIELRRGKPKKGDVAVFQCGRNILRRKIIKKDEDNLTDVLS